MSTSGKTQRTRAKLELADELALRLLYQRLDRLYAVADTRDQVRQASIARYRLTAGLVEHGWRTPEIAATIGATLSQVRHWSRRGKHLNRAGLVLPIPLRVAAAQFPRSLTVADVAAQLLVAPATVRRWIYDGHLRAQRPSGSPNARWQIHPLDLAELWLNMPSETVTETANRYGVTDRTVRQWIKDGKLLAGRSGTRGSYRIPRGR